MKDERPGDSFWLRRLQDLPVLELSTDRTRGPARSLGAGRCSVPIPDALAQRVETLATRYEATRADAIVAAFATLLLRYTAQEDLVVALVSRRPNPPGAPSDVLPLRLDLSGDPTIAVLLRRVTGIVREVRVQGRTGLDEAVERLHPGRDIRRSPVASVAVSLFGGDALAESSLSQTQESAFDLELRVADGRSGFRCDLLYAQDLFDAESVARIAEHFRRVLEAAAAHPDARLSALDLMTAAEERQIVFDWNATDTAYPSDRTVHGLFEDQACRTPEIVALVVGTQRVTYGELNARANRLARHLRALGAESEVPVGVCMERSVEMIVALLGILKSGAAYVPLDPLYPAQRIAFMLRDSGARIVVTQRSVETVVGEGPFAVVRMDAERARIEGEDGGNLDPRSGADSLAYVIYTSGSTGTPKGVGIEHRNAAALLSWARGFYGAGELRGMLASTSICFDLSVFEIFAPLISGGTVILAENALALPQLPAAAEVRIVNTVPSAAAQLIQGAGLPPSVATVNLAGEPLTPSLVAEILRSGTVRRVFDLYGPTEDTTYSTCGQRTEDGPATIGRPLANRRTYILDRNRRPVPPGVIGEIYVAGAGVARGYLNRPELTSEKFLPDPFRGNGGRMYRTGDLARFLPDGRIVFLGRGDQQVKIRGYRIEIGEIEETLSRSPHVRECAVAARESGSGGKRLIGYVVPRNERADVTELRDQLRLTLPEYMVPSAFVFLESLPLTPNGKIDRRALPDPPPDRPEIPTVFAAPRDATETKLCGMAGDLLGITEVGIDDSFFDLGGHSLIATQFLARIRTVFGASLPLPGFFRSPTVRATAAWLAGEGRERGGGASKTRAISRVERGRDLPLSPSQENVWFLLQLDPDNRAYQFQPTLRFRGALDLEALDQSLREIVRRHEIYRTTFPSVDGRPVQRIHADAPPPLEIVDLQSIPAVDREAELERRKIEAIGKPFDLTRLPLMRWTLFRLSPDDHVLQHVEHHMVHDGWSFNVFLREFSALYRAFHGRLGSPLPEPAIQFADFAQYQRTWMESDEAAHQRTFWQRKLSDAPPALEIPSDRPRQSVQTFRGAVSVLELTPDLADSLRAFSRREGGTLFMTMLSAFAILLFRYTNREDFCVGSGVANRRLEETEGLIGMLVNMIALRMDLHGDPTVRELLDRVRETTLEGYENQDFPFAAVVESVRPERTLGHSPLCQVLFSFHDSPLGDLDFGGPRLELQEIVSGGGAKFDLNIIAIPRTEQRVGQKAAAAPGGITLAWEYNTDLFDASTAERMLGHYETLLRSIVADAGRRVSSLPMLTEDEMRDLFPPAGGAAAGPAVPPRLLHRSFESHAARTPSAIALTLDETSLTYDELNRKANRLAWQLRNLGVDAETLVAICLDRSVDMVVAILAILKAGGAYVPLDPSYPPERLAYMLEDAKAPVLVTESGLVRSLQAPAGLRVCLLDADAAAIAARADSNPDSAATPDSAAYVIYTSGSSGRPKGVVITHRNVDRLFTATEPWFQFDERDVWSLFHSYAFDFSVWEIWGALRYGGKLVVVPRAVTRSPEAFLALLSSAGVTVLNQTPSAFRHVIDQDAATPLALRLRLVIFGGEALDPGMLRPWFERHGDESPLLVNMYGITETTVHVTYHPVRRRDLDQPGTSLIGRPIPDLQVYLLDPRMQLCPVGIPGEIHVAGPGLARGYLGRPELTLERFVANPLSADVDGRLYRSGDLGRFRSGGEIEYLGRIDQQVKIRGHRIELGEIESVMGQHPEVQAAVVTARDEGSGNRRLVAYLVGRAATPPAASALRAFLKTLLPDYMIPSVFVPLESLPLTPSGKVDRKALPAPDVARPDVASGFVAPRSESERTLAGLWMQLLKVDRVGVHDNFFELGGDSILSIQIVARANQAGLRLTPKHLFQHQTVAELAAVAEPIRAAAANQGQVSGAVSLTPIQCWFFETDRPDPHHFNQSVVLSAPRLEPAILEKAVSVLASHHDALRLRFVREGGGWLQSNAPIEENPVLQHFDLSTLPAGERRAEFESASARLQAGLDLERGPLFRIGAFDFGDGEPARLAIVVHHLAVDGVSWRVLLEDLETVYSQLAAGDAPRLPAKTVSFQSWAKAVAEYAASPALAKEAEFWSGAASASASAASLPLDRTGGRNTEGSVRKVSASLTAAETRQLLQDVPAAYRTQVNDALLTGLAKAIAPWIGSTTLSVNLEGHGREEVVSDLDVSRTVGWFTTIFPVTLEFDPELEPAAMLKAVKERLRAIPHHGVGYGVLRYLAPDAGVRAALRGRTEPEVSFNYLGRMEGSSGGSSTFIRAAESAGPTRSPAALRRHILDVQVSVIDGRLQVDWHYSENLHLAGTIERLAETFLAALRTLIAHCESLTSADVSASDFPLSGLNQESLGRILERLGKT